VEAVMYEKIISDPVICGGAPCIKGTRILTHNTLNFFGVIGYKFGVIR
jgi:uncharacterized protein (DUF433 family)